MTEWTSPEHIRTSPERIRTSPERSPPANIAPERSRPTRVVVAGMGSEWRRDDGVGLAVAERVGALGPGAHLRATWEVVAPLPDPLDLLGHWDGADVAIVADATRSDAAPGTIRVIELGRSGNAFRAERATSSHGIDVAGAFRLARAVGLGPGRLVVVGVEGEDFGQGAGLSHAVGAAIDEAAHAVLRVIDCEGLSGAPLAGG